MRYPIHKRYEMSEREMRGDGYRSTVIALSIALGAMVLCSMIPLALAGERAPTSAMPSGYHEWCAADESHCPPVERSEIPWSGIIEAHLRKASRRAAWMTHVPEPARTNVWQMGDCERGDCEDKALCMKAWLVRIGYPRGAFRLVWGLDDLGRTHAWLAAYTTAGVVYLDDRQVAFADRWNGEAWFIESFDGHTEGYGYPWNPLPVSAPIQLAFEDKDQ